MFINGQMAESMMENGKIIKWKEEVYLPGQTIEDTRVITLMTRKKARVRFTGLMEESTKASGQTENSMALALTHQHQERQRKDSGQKERESHGCDDSKFSHFSIYLISFIRLYNL